MIRFIAFFKAAKAAIGYHLEQERKSSCQHEWHPSITTKGPARHCTECDTTEQLTTEMYYAQFGTMPHRWY